MKPLTIFVIPFEKTGEISILYFIIHPTSLLRYTVHLDGKVF